MVQSIKAETKSENDEIGNVYYSDLDSNILHSPQQINVDPIPSESDQNISMIHSISDPIKVEMEMEQSYQNIQKKHIESNADDLQLKNKKGKVHQRFVCNECGKTFRSTYYLKVPILF